MHRIAADLNVIGTLERSLALPQDETGGTVATILWIDRVAQDKNRERRKIRISMSIGFQGADSRLETGRVKLGLC
jgi:hypothetical protein